MASIKLTVGLEMLGEARMGEYDSATGLLHKILNNVVASPEEPKFRKLRSSNAKISAMLATRGVRAVLIGVGFVEGGEFLTLPAEAPIEAVQEGITRLTAQANERSAMEANAKEAEQARRKDSEKENEEERKRMRMGISDDAAARKEPGWSAKAAGVKGGRDITSCSDIGIGNSGGG